MAVVIGVDWSPIGWVEYIYEPLDGEMYKIKMVDEAPDPVIGAMTTVIPEKSGRAIRPDNVPSRALIDGAEGPVRDFEHLRSLRMVSTRAKDVIESLEPGVHQFFPIRVERADGSFVETRWGLVVCNRIDSISRDHSYPKPIPGERYGYLVHRKAHPVLRRDKIGGRHLWAESLVDDELLASDALFDALMAAGCTGWGVKRKLEEIYE